MANPFQLIQLETFGSAEFGQEGFIVKTPIGSNKSKLKLMPQNRGAFWLLMTKSMWLILQVVKFWS